MDRHLRWITLVIVLVAAACGGQDVTAPAADATAAANGQTEATDDTASPAATPMTETTVTTANSDLGTILVDGEGLTLYRFDNDTDGESTCYDDCEANWPPLLAEGEPTAAEGADEALLGTVERQDGSTQVTYDGQPLYYFAADQAPGDVNGQAVGDVWWAVAPDGSAIQERSGS